jgi:hypothetical protein
MTNEEIIEEILMEAHALGLIDQVIQTAAKIMQENPRMCKYLAYEQAYHQWVK